MIYTDGPDVTGLIDTEVMNTHVTLVPGFWLGAWAWDEVVPDLEDRGYDVTAVTLPGLTPGEDSSDVGLESHVETIVKALETDAERSVLVVHSGAAIPATVVLDRHPERVDHVIFVDTAPVRDGFAMNADLATATLPLEDAWDEEFEGGAMRDLTEAQLARFRERAVPQPGGTVREPVRLVNDARHAVPGTLVCCMFPAAEFRSYAEQGVPFLAALPDYQALELVDLPTGHWPMWSRPAQLAELIDSAARG